MFSLWMKSEDHPNSEHLLLEEKITDTFPIGDTVQFLNVIADFKYVSKYVSPLTFLLDIH